MIALLQRVSAATVSVDGADVAAIRGGILAFIGVRPDDDVERAAQLLDRILNYRIFADVSGKMNLDLRQVAGGLLLVPQFTLAADTARGRRPGFSSAAPPELAGQLFDSLVRQARGLHSEVQSGVFGAYMHVSSVNDGPVTLWLES